MKTSSEIELELLVDWTDPNRGLSGSAVSIGLHLAVGGCLIFGLNHGPSFRSSSYKKTETRYLDVRNTRLKPLYKTAHAANSMASSNNRSGPISYDAKQTIQQPLALRGTQTLLQPDTPRNLPLPEFTPVPFVMVWSAKLPTISSNISTPIEQVTVPNERPRVATPNQETSASDINLASTPLKSPVPMPQATTQSPLIAPENETPPVSALAVSSAVGTAEPARVMSLSDLHLKNGTVAVPLGNTAVMPSTTDALTMARSNKNAKDGQTNTPGPANSETRTGPVAEQAGIAGGSLNSSARSGASDTDVAASAHIHYPKDGQFGVVIVGNFQSNEYPEAAELWNGRMMYSVYVHVGPGKSWLLQYAPVRNQASENAGGVARPEAPWPYEIVRPALNWVDSDSDTVMMHGFLSASGRLERMELLLPAGFPQEQTIQVALNSWQFRPAQQNGQAISVEVLLIIPSQP
jgi:hypothetical protein